ncbi:MAG TPA: hypothetical protein DC009_07150 [Porphyromonadaceae bacterium]|nr:hypothetical protein [Porphyromonadaceae bacterium]
MRKIFLFIAACAALCCGASLAQSGGSARSSSHADQYEYIDTLEYDMDSVVVYDEDIYADMDTAWVAEDSVPGEFIEYVDVDSTGYAEQTLPFTAEEISALTPVEYDPEVYEDMDEDGLMLFATLFPDDPNVYWALALAVKASPAAGERGEVTLQYIVMAAKGGCVPAMRAMADILVSFDDITEEYRDVARALFYKAAEGGDEYSQEVVSLYEEQMSRR